MRKELKFKIILRTTFDSRLKAESLKMMLSVT